jgi:hypothetical protein
VGFPSLLIVQTPIYLLEAGLMERLTKNINYFKSQPVNIPKITILLDHGYYLEHLTAKLQNIYPQIKTQIKFSNSKTIQKSKKTQEKFGFIPVRARWVIKQSNVWMERCKTLAP